MFNLIYKSHVTFTWNTFDFAQHIYLILSITFLINGQCHNSVKDYYHYSGLLRCQEHR